MKLHAIALLLTSMVALAPSAFASSIYSHRTGFNSKLQVYTGVYETTREDNQTIADLVFLHGYGDRFQNHERLFAELNAQGVRVITFDFPSHGDTSGGMFDDLDFFSFTKLARLAGWVENELAAASDVPLFVAGWSTGGLLATRMAQNPSMQFFSRNISGLVLLAPGVAVHKCVGRKCRITNDTLTHDGALWTRNITPISPLLRPAFASALLINANASWRSAISTKFAPLVIVGDNNNDYYVKTPQVKQWVAKQRRDHESKMFAMQCDLAFHELDNELNTFGGSYVRRLIAQYVSNTVTGSAEWLKEERLKTACHWF